MTWDDANTYVRKLKLGGYSDWRLPTKEELESFLSYCKSKRIPVENGGCAKYYNKIGFKNVQFDYWSSTSYLPFFAWFANMQNGSMSYGLKSDDSYLWPVRSGQ